MAEFAFAQHTTVLDAASMKNPYPFADMEMFGQYKELQGGFIFANPGNNAVSTGAYNAVIHQDEGLHQIFTSSDPGCTGSGGLMNLAPVSSAGNCIGERNSQKKKRKTTVPSGNAAELSSEEKTSPKNNSGRGKKRKQCVNASTDGEVEKPKDVIHVRARRGQATDSHSLAERVRREKINERMRCLQDLVPGCYKTMGVAVMLDEIINYVQSLQNQVEFLSLKLSAASSFFDFNMDATANEIQQARIGWNDQVRAAKEFQTDLLNYHSAFPL